MIKIICGTCATSEGLKTAKDGWLNLPPVEEERLVKRGVAEYMTMPITTLPPQTCESCEDFTELKEEETDIETLSLNKLKALAVDMGLDTKSCRAKADYIAAINTALKSASVQNGEIVIE